MLEEVGVAAASYATLKRRLPAYAKDSWRRRLSAACAAQARLGPAVGGEPGGLPGELSGERHRPAVLPASITLRQDVAKPWLREAEPQR